MDKQADYRVELSAFHPKYVDSFGIEHQEKKSEWCPKFNIGFGLSAHCYAVVKSRWGKYYIKECVVASYQYTGAWGYKMTNGLSFEASDEGKKLFARDNLQAAVDACEKRNRTRKVKVKMMKYNF